MEQITTKSRIALSPLLRVVGGTRTRTMSSKESGTIHSRQNHYLNFIKEKELGNNVALVGFSLNVRNIIMACYTAHLDSGATLLCETIKSGTIKRYLSAAAELSVPAQMMNPTLNLMGKTSVFITDILQKAQRWESMPNRREPITKDIVEYIINKGEKLKKNNVDNLYSAMADWLILGEQGGFRRKEWAQDRTHLL